MACITKATTKDGLAKALRTKVKSLTPEEFRERLVVGLKEKIKSLISMSAKAGKLAAGYSAVHDALEKGRVKMLLYATDLSEGTRDKVAPPDSASIRQATLFTRDEFGKLINRELVGVIGIEDRGIADAIAKETERLKCLINNGE
jgi:ribosomal protein L7Ae-like RNA K-turn-binding protein